MKKILVKNILNYGYCIHPDHINPELHPEQGPVWQWFFENRKEVYERLGANFDKDGAGTLRKIQQPVLAELTAIFDESGATDFLDKIEQFSREKAREMGFQKDDMEDYFKHVFTTN